MMKWLVGAMIFLATPAFAEEATRPTSLAVALGYTMMTYYETAKNPLSGGAMTGKLVAEYQPAGSRWLVAGDIAMDLLPIAQRPSNVSARFLRSGLRAGALFGCTAEDCWHIAVMGGVSYTTMMVSDDSFGFSSLIYPQFYPSIRKAISKGTEIAAYFKYVPLHRGFPVMNLAERELAFGASLELPSGAADSLVLGLDYSNLRYLPDGVSTIRSESATLSVGLKW